MIYHQIISANVFFQKCVCNRLHFAWISTQEAALIFQKVWLLTPALDPCISTSETWGNPPRPPQGSTMRGLLHKSLNMIHGSECVNFQHLSAFFFLFFLRNGHIARVRHTHVTKHTVYFSAARTAGQPPGEWRRERGGGGVEALHANIFKIKKIIRYFKRAAAATRQLMNDLEGQKHFA